MLIDAHAHIHVPEFENDRSAVLERAKEEGVGILINVGFDVEGNFQALSLAKQYDHIYATMGIHPHLASEWNEHVSAQIEKAVIHEPKIIALGEMGLDYFKNFQPKELQIKAFQEQLALAKKLDLPVIIHCREAFDDVFSILKELGNTRVLLHCFTGTRAQAAYAWDRGYYTAFTGIVTYPSAAELREVARMCPPDKLIVETDCPYLAPQSKRGKRNEPSFMKETAESIALIRGVNFSDMETQLEKNTRMLFGI